LILSDFFEMKC